MNITTQPTAAAIVEAVGVVFGALPHQISEEYADTEHGLAGRGDRGGGEVSERAERDRIELERLRAALPKSADGETLVPGMTVWVRDDRAPAGVVQVMVRACYARRVTVDQLSGGVRVFYDLVSARDTWVSVDLAVCAATGGAVVACCGGGCP